MRQIIRSIFIVILCSVLHHSVQAQISESEIKAAYIERFTRFVEWPAHNQDTSITITVLGENSYGSSLSNLFKEVKIKNRKVIIQYVEDYTKHESTDILILCSSVKGNLKEILDFVEGKPILIISDSEGFAQLGVHINMYLNNNYIRYEINPKAIENAGLKVSSLLLASAKIIKTDE